MTTARSDDGAVHVAAVAQSGAGHTLGACGTYSWTIDHGPTGPVTCPACIAWTVTNADPDTGELPDISTTPRAAKPLGGDCTTPTARPCADHPWDRDPQGNAWCTNCGACVTQTVTPAGCQVTTTGEPFGSPVTHPTSCPDTPEPDNETGGPSMHAARLWWQLHGTRAQEAS